MPHLITVLFCPYKTMSSGYTKHRVKVIFSFGNPLLLFFSYRTLMGSRQLHAEVEVKSPADKFWGSIRDSTSVFPKAFPQDYKSIEVLEGDGKAPGSVRLITYSDGSPIVKVSKEKIDAVDDAERWVAYSVIDGDLLKYYKVFKGRIYVIPMGEGSLVKWSCEFEKASDEIPDPNIIKEFAVKNFKELDAFVLQA